MDLATLVGLLGAIGVILTAIFLGGSAGMFIDIPSICIVVVGSIFVVAMKFKVKQMTGAAKVAGKAFMFKSDTAESLIELATQLAGAVRKEGLLALEKFKIENDFLAKGVTMLVDGLDPEIVKGILVQEKNLSLARHEEGQRIFKAFGDVSPAMGMIGTLVGLVQMLANMSDPAAIGPAMAVALLTTMYGAVIANVICLPIADKLGMRMAEEEALQALMVDAIVCIHKGLHPSVVRDSLQNYLPKGDRKAEDAA